MSSEEIGTSVQDVISVDKWFLRCVLAGSRVYVCLWCYELRFEDAGCMNGSGAAYEYSMEDE